MLFLDLANPKSNKRNAGFTDEEREDMTSLLDEGFIDSYRTLYPEKEKAYTFWTYMMNARAKNVGWYVSFFYKQRLLVFEETCLEPECDSQHKQTLTKWDTLEKGNGRNI